jgi:uncharacterized protein YbcI
MNNATTLAAQDRLVGGKLNSAIATAVVRTHRRCVGRGPTRAQAFHRGNVVVLVLEDTMTREELSLAANDMKRAAWLIRTKVQTTMRGTLVGIVEELTGRRVVAFMGDNHIDPDLVTAVFVLDRPVSGPRTEAG